MLNKILTLMRENEGMTIHEVASKLSVSSEAALDYELGKVRPTPEIIKKYSEIFGVPVSSIMFFSKEDDDGVLSHRIPYVLCRQDGCSGRETAPRQRAPRCSLCLLISDQTI